MLENFNDKFEYKKLTEEEQSKRGILGRLVGVIADTKNPTRNGRKYNKELWEKVFNDPIMEEKIKNKVVFGELGHPSDRTETDISKAAIVLSEKPKLKRDGKLYGVFDILDTPNGRILKTLCDYGTTIGVSSRGEGDVIEDYDGQESVDPDTYSCECWDAVLLPAVKEARMDYVTESLNTKDLRTKLSEEVNKANDGDKEIMQETLEKLDIKLTEEEDKSKEDVNLDLSESISPQLYTKAIQAINNAIESDEDLEEIRQYLQDIIGYCRSVADDYGVLVESLDEKLVEPSEEDLAPIEAKFAELGLDIEGKGKTLFGNIHYQLRKELDHKVTRNDISPIFAELANLDDHYTMPVTCNVGVHKDGDNIISASVDVSKKYVKDEVEEDLLNKEDNSKADDHSVNEEVVDNQSMLSELQEALKNKKDLEAEVMEVQNRLAVSDAKVETLEEGLNKYKDLSAKLGLKAKESKEKISELQESLNFKDKTIKQLKESRVKFANKTKSLNESISNKDGEVKKLNENLSKKNDEVNKLTESLEEALANSKIQEKQHEKEVQKLSNLAEAYKKVANSTMKRYIESKATMYGLSFKDIRNKLPDSYTADDVDKICESLRSYSINSMRLPINTGARMKFTESKNDNLRVINPGDEVDEDLLNLANSIK